MTIRLISTQNSSLILVIYYDIINYEVFIHCSIDGRLLRMYAY